MIENVWCARIQNPHQVEIFQPTEQPGPVLGVGNTTMNVKINWIKSPPQPIHQAAIGSGDNVNRRFNEEFTLSALHHILCRDIRADNYQGHFPELLKLAAYMQRPQLAAERLVVRPAGADIENLF